ncbi:hypothetical protein [Corynebacterium guangdongense]|uniref:Uncharacterized protein n=1 Tax=Corynebacterium guangdongense TaxID=1783348 RepID=A0ABU1ZZT9_9CORY|nr:hypothetical protein [Corynebacterium guangdongense]MDR7330444.1 hypothetical protein [Corynebacterium guangdongense]WJZ19002.1 hypothetical protein CGUA_12335 [Corynebacterium guangdongense]
MTQPAAGHGRRMRGAFWTPLPWAHRAHELLDAHLGPAWHEDFVVWDPACGGLNLTRPRAFGELYASTLHLDEVDAAANPEAAAVFAFDFLNDPLSALPAGLLDALRRRRPIVLLANPPYAQATDYEGARKASVASTAVAGEMDGLGHARSELYTQFYFRAMGIAAEFGYERDFHIVFFTKAGYLTSPSFAAFTRALTSRFGFRGGFLFNAGEFDGASRHWGVVLAHWELGADGAAPEFPVLGPGAAGVWRPRVVDKHSTISAWLAEIPVAEHRDPDAPLTTNGLDPAGPRAPLVMRRGWLGYLHNNGDNVQYSAKYTGLYSMGFGSAHGREVTRENIWRAAVVFAVRRAVHTDIEAHGLTWVRDKDIFRGPSPALLDDAFLTDCLVYSLVDNQSRQTSLRNWHGHGRIPNEFFPFARASTGELGGAGPERFVHTLLKGRTLTPGAARVLALGEEILAETMPRRRLFHVEQPRFQVLNWDAGWRQISPMVAGPARARFRTAVRDLGVTIAARAYADGIIDPPV